MTETLFLLAFLSVFFAVGCSQARRRFERMDTEWMVRTWKGEIDGS